MLVFPQRKTDAEFIEQLRVCECRMQRWRWPLVIGAAFVSMVSLAIALMFNYFVQGSAWSLRIVSVEFEIIYGIGFLGGLLIGPAFMSTLFVCFGMSIELRTWHLLLAYHDRLAQAGLLPQDASEKMNAAEPASSRS